MINFQNKEQCVGCGVCESVCPQQCICIKLDEEGFFYPVVDMDRCVECNLCDKVCLANDFYKGKVKQEVRLAYAAKNTNPSIRMNGSSGGVFWELARNILEKNGLVYGVTFAGDFNVQHKCVTNLNELEALCGSKYLPSKAGNVFNDIKKYLLDKRWVLFSGTPCQVSSLYAFLGKRYPNLITVSVACHGIPSLKVWYNYKKWLETKYKSGLVGYRFRGKKTGWHNYSIEAKFSDGNMYQSKFQDDPYMKLFVGNISLRESCYKCKFRGKNSDADIILGDFWAVRDFIPELDDDKGISLVVIHTEVGKKLLESVATKLHLHNVDYNDAIRSNLALVKSPILMNNRKQFFRHFGNMDFEEAVALYTKKPIWKRIIIVAADIYVRAQRLFK